MMLTLLFDGQYTLIAILLFAVIFSLSFHEFGHAAMAKYFGDNTAESAGRLTVNPVAHIDPMGLLMVMTLGFGYAKPVPTNPYNFTSRYATLWVAAAGPGMNLLLAVISINLFWLGYSQGWSLFLGETQAQFFYIITIINLVLMIFNLIPIGPLDGHYILPYFLPKKQAQNYIAFNAQYGTMILLLLIVLSFVGIPVFHYVSALGQAIMPWITFYPV